MTSTHAVRITDVSSEHEAARGDEGALELAADDHVPPPAPIDLHAARRRRGWVRPAIAAAAVVAVAGGVTAVVANRDSGDDTTDVATVALTNEGLDPRGASSSGDATLVRRPDGTYALQVDVSDLPNDRSECWIFHARGVGDGPIARVALPERISSGTHACWAPAASLPGW